MYEGGIVTISFLSHVFFLISVVRCPYFSFAPSYQETDRYLLAFLSYSSSLPLVLPCSTGLSHSLVTSLMVTMFPLPSIKFYNLPLR